MQQCRMLCALQAAGHYSTILSIPSFPLLTATFHICLLFTFHFKLILNWPPNNWRTYRGKRRKFSSIQRTYYDVTFRDKRNENKAKVAKMQAHSQKWHPPIHHSTHKVPQLLFAARSISLRAWKKRTRGKPLTWKIETELDAKCAHEKMRKKGKERGNCWRI